MLSPLTNCNLPANPIPEDIDFYKDCLVAERQIQSVQNWRPLIENYFEESDVDKALRIVYCESRGKSTAVGRNTNGTTDVGLWQFNDDTWAWLKAKLKITSTRFNPEVSTAVASWLVYNDGWYH
mgnify:CR=1 FL=1